LYPEELKYNPEHTWLKMETADTGRVGITQYAQEQLKEVVFIELPEVGTEVKHMEPFGVIESVKATNDLFSPVSGTVVEVNTALKDEPGMVNTDPYGKGWMVMVRLSNPVEVNKLVSADEYKALVKA
jgi:glycine cleavage system H protein